MNSSEPQEMGLVGVGWILRAREVTPAALDALRAAVAGVGGAWRVAVQGAALQPIDGESVFVGVEVAQHPTEEYFEGGLRPDEADALEGTVFTRAQVQSATKAARAHADAVLGWVTAQGLALHPDGPTLYLLACGPEARARVTGAGMKPVFNGPDSFGPRAVKTKGTEFSLVAWGQPV